jgi:triacylglycerol esterase/lipase EstA (alpha/beta hydrolase family)
MLALLLRALYLFLLLCGAWLGSWLALQSTQHGFGALSLLWVPLATLGLPLLLHFLVILNAMILSRTGDAGARWWRQLWAEYRSAVVIFMLRQPWPRRPNGVQKPLTSAHAQSAPSAVPVVLVHGYLCNHRVWDDLALALRQAGHPVLAIDLEPLFGSIDDYAVVIEAAVKRLQHETGAPQVALAGHSMGGLAIRAWLRTLDTTQMGRVARILTLGTPHQGTRIPQPVATRNGRQMFWHSDWVKALQASESAEQHTLMHIALNLNDNICFPQADQTVPGVLVTEFHGIGHLEMCRHPRVINWTCQQLADGATQRTHA